MSANKYVSLSSGKLKEVVPAVTSAANAIVALDSTGHLDVSVLPTGVGPDVLTMASFENLTAGNFVNYYSNAGTINARKADATTNAKPALGFVLANVTAPASCTVYLLGSINTALTGLTVGADYWLDTTAGGITTTPPSATGNISQYIGRANSTTSIQFINTSTIEVA